MYLRVSDQAWSSDCNGNICDAADCLFNAENRGNALDVIDAVLQRDHTGILADQRARLLGRLLGIP
jgi:hypothetical protein